MRRAVAVVLVAVAWAGFALRPVPVRAASWAAWGYSILRWLDRGDIVHHEIRARIDPLRLIARFEDDVTLRTTPGRRSLHILLGADLTLERVVDPRTGDELRFSRSLSLGSVPYVLYSVSLPASPARSALGGSGASGSGPSGSGGSTGGSEGAAGTVEHVVRFEWSVTSESARFISPFVAPRYFYIGYASLWYPQTPAEDFFTAHIQVVTPDGYLAFGEGERVECSSHTAGAGELCVAYRTEAPVDKMSLGAGPYAVETVATIEVWRPPGRPSDAAGVAGHVAKILEFFNERLGPLPARVQRVVEVPFLYPATYPTAGQLVYGGPLEHLGLGGEAGRAVIAAHETAHKWLGGLAGFPPLGSAWVVEGLAEYLGHLALAHVLGEEEAARIFAWRVAHPYAEAAPERRERRLADIEVFDEDSQSLFRRGAFVFRMLHRRMGDEAFFAGIRAFIGEYAGKHASASDFEGVMIAHAPPGERAALRRYLRAWVYDRESLDYALTVVNNEASPTTDDGERSVTVSVQSLGAWEEPGEVDVEIVSTSGKRTRVRLAPGGTAHVRLTGAPLCAVLDPGHWLADHDLRNNIWLSPSHIAAAIAASTCGPQQI